MGLPQQGGRPTSTVCNWCGWHDPTKEERIEHITSRDIVARSLSVLPKYYCDQDMSNRNPEPKLPSQVWPMESNGQTPDRSDLGSHASTRTAGLSLPADTKRLKDWPYHKLLDRATIGTDVYFLVQWSPTWVRASQISQLKEASANYEHSPDCSPYEGCRSLTPTSNEQQLGLSGGRHDKSQEDCSDIEACSVRRT